MVWFEVILGVAKIVVSVLAGVQPLLGLGLS